MKRKNSAQGFTVIELFITLGVIAIISLIAFFIFNPLQRYKEARDMERQDEVEFLGNALAQCIFNNGGRMPDSLSALKPGANYIIGSAKSSCAKFCQTVDTENECFDLSAAICEMEKLFVPEYISSVPADPIGSRWDTERTGYYIQKTVQNDIVIGACSPEGTIIRSIKEL